MMNPDTDVPLVLTAAECNIILSVLAEQPYRVVAAVITKLQHQILAVDPAAFEQRPPAAINGSAAHVPD